MRILSLELHTDNALWWHAPCRAIILFIYLEKSTVKECPGCSWSSFTSNFEWGEFAGPADWSTREDALKWPSSEVPPEYGTNGMLYWLATYNNRPYKSSQCPSIWGNVSLLELWELHHPLSGGISQRPAMNQVNDLNISIKSCKVSTPSNRDHHYDVDSQVDREMGHLTAPGRCAMRHQVVSVPRDTVWWKGRLELFQSFLESCFGVCRWCEFIGRLAVVSVALELGLQSNYVHLPAYSTTIWFSQRVYIRNMNLVRMTSLATMRRDILLTIDPINVDVRKTIPVDHLWSDILGPVGETEVMVWGEDLVDVARFCLMTEYDRVGLLALDWDS